MPQRRLERRFVNATINPRVLGGRVHDRRGARRYPRTLSTETDQSVLRALEFDGLILVERRAVLPSIVTLLPGTGIGSNQA